jgi:hypothetical protein
MAHITVDKVLSAEVYNSLLIDHDATEQAARLQLKSNHVPDLAKILAIHGVSDYVELHLLHRHFILQEGEAILHKPCVIPGSDGNTSITVDIAKPSRVSIWLNPPCSHLCGWPPRLADLFRMSMEH